MVRTLLLSLLLSGSVVCTGQALHRKHLTVSLGGGAGLWQVNSDRDDLTQDALESGAIRFAFGYAIADRWSLGIHYDRVGSARHDGLLARARATTYLIEGAYRPWSGQHAFLEINLGLGAHITALFPTTERLPYTATGSAGSLGIRYAHLLSGTVGLYLAADHAASSSDALTLNGGRVNADGSTSIVQWNTQRITAGLMVRF